MFIPPKGPARLQAAAWRNYSLASPISRKAGKLCKSGTAVLQSVGRGFARWQPVRMGQRKIPLGILFNAFEFSCCSCDYFVVVVFWFTSVLAASDSWCACSTGVATETDCQGAYCRCRGSISLGVLVGTSLSPLWSSAFDAVGRSGTRVEVRQLVFLLWPPQV